MSIIELDLERFTFGSSFGFCRWFREFDAQPAVRSKALGVDYATGK